jgi:hypothetical protein
VSGSAARAASAPPCPGEAPEDRSGRLVELDARGRRLRAARSRAVRSIGKEPGRRRSESVAQRLLRLASRAK